MALGKLTAVFVERARKGLADPGKYYDGGGLILRTKEGGSASWLFRYDRGGKRRDLGLGALAVVSLAQARELAGEQRRTLAAGNDPLRQKRAARAANASAITFDKAAELYIDAHKAGWKNPKHAAQWPSTLKTYVSPKFGNVAVADVDTEHVLSALTPIWNAKPETASRVRGRIEVILDWAKARGMRDGDNPARWRGHLGFMLPQKGKLRAVKHHAAVAVDDLPKVYEALAKSSDVAAAAVRFCLLTAARPSEAARATWDEIDMDAACWTVAPERQKSGKPHRVPLSDEALAVLKAMAASRLDGDPHVFPGGRANTFLSLTSLSNALQMAGGGKATVHGSARSGFDDWGSERTHHSQKLIDRALAHGPKSKTVAAYRRSELFEGRKPLMADWERFSVVSAGDLIRKMVRDFEARRAKKFAALDKPFVVKRLPNESDAAFEKRERKARADHVARLLPLLRERYHIAPNEKLLGEKLARALLPVAHPAFSLERPPAPGRPREITDGEINRIRRAVAAGASARAACFKIRKGNRMEADALAKAYARATKSVG